MDEASGRAPVDIQALHEEQIKSELRAKFEQEYPRRMLESVEEIRETLARKERGNEVIDGEIFRGLERLANIEGTNKIHLATLNLIAKTLTHIKWALFFICATLIYHFAK